MSHVFISYVSENKKEVQRLCDELTKHGVQVWLDRDKIKPGHMWQEAIQEAIRSGDFFIACFSKDYLKRDKTYFNEELTLAIEELRQYSSDRSWFIPVLLSEFDVPPRSIGGGKTLRDIQWVKIFTDWEAGIQRILDVIKPISAEVRRCIDALQSNNNVIRVNAAGELGDIGDARAVPALIDALSDKDMHVRSDTAGALSNIRDERAVPALIKALVDKEYDKVREKAHYALLNIGRPAIPALKEALSDDNRAIREKAAKTLRDMGELGGIEEAFKIWEEYNRNK